jgi:hypothetical protein
LMGVGLAQIVVQVPKNKAIKINFFMVFRLFLNDYEI